MRRVARGGRTRAKKVAIERREALDRLVGAYFGAKWPTKDCDYGVLRSPEFSIRNFPAVYHEVYAELASLKMDSLRNHEDAIPIVTLTMEATNQGFLIICHCDDFMRAARRLHRRNLGGYVLPERKEELHPPAKVARLLEQAERMLPTQVHEANFEADEL